MSKVMIDAKIFSCTQSLELAGKIAEAYGAPLGNVITSHYSDGEFQPSFEESVRGARVFIIGSTHPGSDHLMEMLLMLDAAKRASCRGDSMDARAPSPRTRHGRATLRAL